MSRSILVPTKMALGEKGMSGQLFQITKKFAFAMAISLTLFSKAFAAKADSKSEPIVLNTQVGEEIRHLDPQLSTGVSSSHININMFTGLFEYHHKTGEPTEGLAKSHSSNQDATVWTFKLRDDIHWVKHVDGEVKKQRKVTANDVVFSYRRILAPETASEYAYMLYVLKNGEDYNKGKIKDASKLGVKALDEQTVQLTLQGSVPTLLQYLPHHSFTVVPREPIEQFKEKWIEKGKIWTNGPFVFKDWKLKERIEVVKNPHHPEASEVQLDQINFKFIGTYSPESVRAFRAGGIDIDFQPPPTSEISPLLKSKNLIAARQLGTYFIRMNVTKPALKDVRVRRALALAIPRGKIVKYIMKAGQVPTLSFVPKSMNGYKPKNLTNVRAHKDRIALAKKLMKEAGYENGKGFPEITYLYNTAETHQKVAVVIAKEWNKVLGIKVKPLNQEWKVYLNSQKSLDYEVSRSGWVADMADPMNFLEMFIADGGNNNTGFSNKKYDSLILAARGERDLNKRNRLLEQAEEILMTEVPVLPIFNYTSINLKQNYISGFHANKLDQHPLKFIKIDMAAKKKAFANR